MRLLIVNPNTSSAMTQRLHDHVRATVGPDIALQTATARFGASYIADETSFAVAGHAAIDAFATHCEAHGEPDAVLLGCFGDPGVFALREMTKCPVIGLSEAAMHEAAGHGRFSIVTGGPAWKAMLERLARTLGYAGALAAVHTVAPTGAQLAADPQGALPLLANACREATVQAHAVILGGAGLAGMASLIAPQIDVPVIDSVTAGAAAVLRMAAAPAPSATPPSTSASWQGVSTPLLRRLC